MSRVRWGGIASGGVRRARQRCLGSARSSRDAVQRHEAAEARAFLLAEQHLIQAAEPGAQLARTGAACRPRRRWSGSSRRRRPAAALPASSARSSSAARSSRVGCAVAFLRPDEVAVIGDGVVHQPVEQRHASPGVASGIVAADEAPQDVRRRRRSPRWPGSAACRRRSGCRRGSAAGRHGCARPGWSGARPATACARASALARYSSTARGITSKYSRLARCGALNMNCARISGGA